MSNPKAADLANYYSAFSVTQRTLLTGHSHQAWPDCALKGQMQAWHDAAEWVDSKWGTAFEKADKLKAFYSHLLSDTSPNNYVLAQNTHDLLIRFISSLDWSSLNKKSGQRIVTTDGEFHSMRRQLARLEEEGIEIVRVPVAPFETLCERICTELTDKTMALMMSAVMFKNAAIIPHLNLVGRACSEKSIPHLIDVYHALNVVPFSIETQSLENAFLVGGGYKYCQFGEGNCFMRVPEACNARPIITGWYAEFGELEQSPGHSEGIAMTQYPLGANRFQGSTYDPTSHYRACSVIDFFKEHNLTPTRLRSISQHQIALLRDAFDDLDLDSKIISRADVPLETIGGFLSLKTEKAAQLQKSLKDKDIWTDQRDGYLRLGPAPYLSDQKLRDAISALGETI